MFRYAYLFNTKFIMFIIFYRELVQDALCEEINDDNSLVDSDQKQYN